MWNVRDGPNRSKIEQQRHDFNTLTFQLTNMSHYCSRANFTQVKLCAMFEVIGKSSIFPITEQQRAFLKIFSVYNILRPVLLFGTNFSQVKLCAMLDILEKSLIILKWNERDRGCPFIIWKTQQNFLVLLAHEVKTKIKYFIFGFNTYN